MRFSASTYATLPERSPELSVLHRICRNVKRAEDQLAEANRHLLDTSRRAGMAEVATSVIHNVGMFSIA